MATFKTADTYKPTGDQPQAIDELSASILAGERYQTMLGATGTGKTATMAWLIEKVGRPALVIAHNKTLAAQLCNEFREFFPRTRSSISSPTTTTTSPRRTSLRPTSTSRRTRRATTTSIGYGTRRPRRCSRAGTRSLSHRSLRSTASAPRGVRAACRPAHRRRGDRPRPDAAQADRHPVRAQRHGAWPGPLPGQGRRDRGAAGVLGVGVPDLAVRATKSSRSRTSTR